MALLLTMQILLEKMTMLAPEDFIAAGYHKFTGYTGHYNADFGLQKLIADDIGKRYYITISVYDNSKFKDSHPTYFKEQPWSFTPHVQFVICSRITTSIEFLITTDTTIAEIEEYFDRIWTRMNCEYYERFEE